MKNESYMDSDELEEIPGQSGGGILGILTHMQQQLTFLEKKVDMLLSRTEGERQFKGERQFGGARPAPKPFRKPYDRPSQRFDRPPRRDHRNNDDEDRERGYRDRESSRTHYFDRRKSGKKPGGKPRPEFGKKPYYSRFSE